MKQAWRVLARTIHLWWREFFVLTFFNLAWLALQIPIVSGPPATAAIYLIARRVADDELIELRYGWEALRRMFLPAWKWGALNALIAAAVVGNFWFYQNAVGWVWIALRLVWGTIALGWFAVNLFYWPFWLAQENRSLRTALRNATLFLMKEPGLGLTLVLISAIIIGASILLTLPLAALMMTWLALIGVLAVDEALHPRDEDDTIVIELIQ